MARSRKIGSIKNELIHKSKESMLSAVQIFNNPNMQFKSESFIVLSGLRRTPVAVFAGDRSIFCVSLV